MRLFGLVVTSIFLSMLVLGGCATEPSGSGLHRFQGRDYLLHVPASREKASPLVLVMHGYGGDAMWMRDELGWVELADAEGFVVCFPNGTLDRDGRRFWNVGYAMHEDSRIDDVDYLVELACHLQTVHALDPGATFASGFSNGADMSFLLACKAPETFHAIGPVAGTMMDALYRTATPSLPRSVIAFNGVRDRITRTDGDMDDVDGWGAYRSTSEVIAFWTGLDDLPNHERRVLAAPDGASDPGGIELDRYWSPRHRREVRSYLLMDGGHDWPLATDGGGLDATSLIWEFFDRQP